MDFFFIDKVSSACGLVYYGIEVGMPHLYLIKFCLLYIVIKCRKKIKKSECRFDQMVPVLLTQGRSGAFCSHEE
jgi:hypothetical protein